MSSAGLFLLNCESQSAIFPGSNGPQSGQPDAKASRDAFFESIHVVTGKHESAA